MDSAYKKMGKVYLAWFSGKNTYLDFSAPAGANRHIQFQPASTHDEQYKRIEDRDYGRRGGSKITGTGR
jgi:hypothetical protein